MNVPAAIAHIEIQRRLEKYDRMVVSHDALVAALKGARKYFWIVKEYAGDKVNVQPAIDEINGALAAAGETP